jgi:hypothetical protein
MSITRRMSSSDFKSHVSEIMKLTSNLESYGYKVMVYSTKSGGRNLKIEDPKSGLSLVYRCSAYTSQELSDRIKFDVLVHKLVKDKRFIVPITLTENSDGVVITSVGNVREVLNIDLSNYYFARENSLNVGAINDLISRAIFNRSSHIPERSPSPLTVKDGMLVERTKT